MAQGLRFDFLGQQHSLDSVGWDDPSVDRLWRYNLHYFDDLNAEGAAQRRPQQAQWIGLWQDANPPGPGTAWEPYPTSLRIVNWIKAFLGDLPASPAALDSLATQARWLCGRLEWHLLGNHLFANAKALMAAGMFFEGTEADRWRSIGKRILLRELPEQILADGAQFELSPMYHALALEDVLDLLNLARALPTADADIDALALGERARAMLGWLRAMSHPDGGISLFNDAADGIAPPNSELERYASALGVDAPQPLTCGVVDLAASGYVRMSLPDSVLLIDAAPIGPDYLVGHAHADTLAFEWSLRGRRILVNGGTSRYGLGPERLRERGTGWHNTVEVGGLDSSEVWSGFRVGRRARIVERQVHGASVQAAHDGWRHLPGSPIHRRRWTQEAAAFTVNDWLGDVDGTTARSSALADDGPGKLPGAVARFHLAPDLALAPEGSGRWSVRDAAGRVCCSVEVLEGEGRIEPSLHAPRFGERHPAWQLAVGLRAGRAEVRWQW